VRSVFLSCTRNVTRVSCRWSDTGMCPPVRQVTAGDSLCLLALPIHSACQQSRMRKQTRFTYGRVLQPVFQRTSQDVPRAIVQHTNTCSNAAENSKYPSTRVTSGLRREVNGNFALLGYYADSGGNSLSPAVSSYHHSLRKRRAQLSSLDISREILSDNWQSVP